MKNKPNFLPLLLGLLLIGFIVWNRVLRIRENYLLTTTDSLFKLFLTALVFVIFVTLFWVNLKLLLELSVGTNKYIEKLLNLKVFLYIKNCLNYVFVESPKEVYKYIFDFFCLLGFIEHYGSYLALYLNNNPQIFYIIFFVLPRSMFSIVMFLDTIMFNQVRFVNHIAWILMVPLCFRAILYAINHTADYTIVFLNRFFIMNHNEENTRISIQYKKLTNLDEINYQDEANLDAVYNSYFVSLELKRLIDSFYGSFDNYKYYYRCFLFGLLSLTFLCKLLLLLGINYSEIFQLFLNKEEPFSGMFF
jgi:hypothetical protein